MQDLPIHLYDLGTGNQVKIPSEVMIPETRDYACFFSANSTQKPALYDTADATANSRINARLPYIFLLSRIAHYLKLIQRENIGTTKDRRLRALSLTPAGQTLPLAEKTQLEMHLKQLTTRYNQIKQNGSEQIMTDFSLNRVDIN